MSIINSQPRIGAAGQSTGFKIERSLRFNSADTANLNRTFSSSGNRKTWTWSGWVKRALIESEGTLFSGSPNASNYSSFSIGRSSGNRYLRFFNVSTTLNLDVITSSVYRDASAWYHIVLAVDTTQATDSNRVKIYVNGVQVTAFGTATYPSQNTDLVINQNCSHTIGKDADVAGGYLDAYITECYFIDGSAKTPSDFGETDTDTGVWKPKAYSGSYGTNGFYLKFADNSGTTSTTLGKDSSGNGNNWTPNNFSVTAGAGNDSLVDTPTPYGTDTGAGGEVRGNYATLNPLDNGGLTLSNGNITVARSASGWLTCRSTFAMSSGKWYWEYSDMYTGTSDWSTPGIAKSTAALNGQLGADASGWIYIFNGNKYTNATQTSYGATWNGSNVIGVAFDADAGTLTFYKDGVSQGTAFSSLTSGPYFPAISMSAASGTLTSNINFGQRPFAYTAPSGFKALCTQNLPTPTIGATATTRADDYFNIALYTGNNSTNAITGLGFSPDLVWIKSRSNAENNLLFDTNRGRGYGLYSNLTNAEAGPSPSDKDLVSFDSDGFTLGQIYNFNVNDSGKTFVGWAWRGSDSAAVSNTQGTITSTVSANTTAGFSIVTATAQSSGVGTFGHGLGVAPSMVIIKGRGSASSWGVYHISTGSGGYLLLNSTSAYTTDLNFMNNTSPSSTVFTLGASYAGYGTFVTYCFAPVAGYSAFGSYTGNGSADGPFVYTGFRPAWVLFKLSSASGIDWMVFDAKRNTYNAVNSRLFPSLSNAEADGAPCDFLSNGFKMRENNDYHNRSGATYVYAAFAEVPTKFSLAR